MPRTCTSIAAAGLRSLAVGSGVLLLLAFAAPVAREQDPAGNWAARFEEDKDDALRLAVLVEEMAAADAAAAGRDPVREAAWTQAGLHLLYSTNEAGAVPEDPSWLSAVEAARAPVEKYGSLRNRAYFAYVLARNSVDTGRWRKALPLIEEAIAAALAAGEKRPDLWIDLMEALVTVGDAVRALDTWREHQSELTALLDPERAATAWGLATEAYLLCGLPELAAVSLEEFDRISAPLGPEYAIERALRRAHFARATEDYDTALALSSALLDGAQALQPHQRPHVLLLRGMAQWEKTRVSGSLEPARASLRAALAEPGIIDRERFSATLMLALLELRANDMGAASAHLEDARALLARRSVAVDDIVSPDEVAFFEAQSAQYALRVQAPVEELRAHKERLNAAFEALWRNFEAGRARVGGLGFLYHMEPRFVGSVLIQLELALDAHESGEEAALSVLLRAQRAGSATRGSTVGIVDLASVKRALCSEGTGIIVLLPVFGLSHVFLVDSDGVSHHLGADSDVLDEDVRFLEGLSMSPYFEDTAQETEAAIAHAARRLTGHLLEPAAREHLARWRGVYVVGAELLRDLPFESLRLEEDREIGLEMAVSYLSSLPLGIWLAQRADARDAAHSQPDASDASVVFVLGPEPGPDADPAGPLPPLVLEPDEVQLLTGPFESARLSLIQGADAVPACLSSTLVRHGDVLVIVGHGIYDLRHGERATGLAFTAKGDSSGVVWIEDVERLEVPPIVLLYTCGSARSQVRMGDDSATHMGGAFQVAGADTVLVSRGDVQLSSALALGHVMHEWLARGEAAAEALRHARVAAASDPKARADLRRARVCIDGLGLRASPKLRAHVENQGRGWLASGWILGAIAAAIALGLILASRPRALPAPASR